MAETLRALIIEDSGRDFDLTVRELRLAGYQPVVRRIETECAMTAALNEETWDCILSDHALPEFNADGALATLQASGLDIPFIIVSGMIGEERAVDLMKAGADDYVSKQNLARLVPIVERVMREAAERRERKRVEAQLAALNRERERMLNQRSTLLDINNAVIANLDRDSLFAAIFRAVRRTLPCDSLFVTLRDSESGGLRSVSLRERGIEGQIHVEEAICSPCTWVIEQNRTLSRSDLAAGLEIPGEAALLADGVRSYIAAPLLTKSDPFGSLTITSGRPGGLTLEDTDFFEQVCRQVSLAIENMLAFEQIGLLKARLERENAYLIEEIRSEHNFEQMVGGSPAFLTLKDRIQRVAPTDATVLITGESGTGKELVARAIHSRSSRRNKPLVKINCAAISAGLVESELFGHVKGAFTGATDRRVGRFEFADGGTLFLDEVGELPLDTQVKLLRVLQEREFEPVGSNRSIQVDVRVIAATNRRLEDAIRDGRFRADLYFRLNVVPIEMPPLRDRRSDIPELVASILNNCARQFGRTVDSITEESLERLMRYDWPGNIRELHNVLSRAVVLSTGPVLELGDDLLPPAPPSVARLAERVDGFSTSPAPEPSPSTLENIEKRHIVEVLERVRWVIEGPRGAAQVLGLHPNTLRSRMKKLGVERPRSAN